jgi:hypothetical protein
LPQIPSNTKEPNTLISVTTFLRDHVSKGDIVMESVRTDDQLADIFIKPLDETRFCKLRSELNVIDLSNIA